MKTEYSFCSVIESPQMARTSFCLRSGFAANEQVENRMARRNATRRALMIFSCDTGLWPVRSAWHGPEARVTRVLHGRDLQFFRPHDHDRERAGTVALEIRVDAIDVDGFDRGDQLVERADSATHEIVVRDRPGAGAGGFAGERKSTRLNSSH